MDGYCSKPVATEKLLEMMNKHLLTPAEAAGAG